MTNYASYSVPIDDILSGVTTVSSFSGLRNVISAFPDEAPQSCRSKSKRSKDSPTILVADDGTVVEKPKRLRTAYNIFFQHHRQVLLEKLPARSKKPRNSHGKIGFTSLAQTIAAQWRNITAEEKAYFEDLSQKDRIRYKREMKAWKELQEKCALMDRSAAVKNSVATRELLEAGLPQMTCQAEPIDLQEIEPISFFNKEEDTFNAEPQIPIEPLPLTSLPRRCMGSHLYSKRAEYRRLAQSLGADCVSVIIKTFRN